MCVFSIHKQIEVLSKKEKILFGNDSSEGYKICSVSKNFKISRYFYHVQSLLFCKNLYTVQSTLDCQICLIKILFITKIVFIISPDAVWGYIGFGFVAPPTPQVTCEQITLMCRISWRSLDISM